MVVVRRAGRGDGGDLGGQPARILAGQAHREVEVREPGSAPRRGHAGREGRQLPAQRHGGAGGCRRTGRARTGRTGEAGEPDNRDENGENGAQSAERCYGDHGRSGSVQCDARLPQGSRSAFLPSAPWAEGS